MLKLAFAMILISLSAAFMAFRFGLFEEKGELEQSITQIIPPTPSPTSSLPKPTPEEIIFSSQSAIINLLDGPKEASASQTLTIRWFIESPKIATISHTAVHFGKSSRPNAKFPSDYPEKSTILKGQIPATFSAQILIPLPGIYYYRAHAILENLNLWSNEQTLNVAKTATASATPTP